MNMKKMIKSISVITLFLVGNLVFFQCSSDMPNSNKTDSSTIALNISINSPCIENSSFLPKTATIQKVVVTVTASGMSTITRELTGSGDNWSGDITVPQGKARTFLIEAKDANNIVQYNGTSTKDLTQATETIDIELDAQYPTPVTLSLGTVTQNSITITWSQSTDVDFDHYTITRKTSSGSQDLNQDRLTQIRTGASSTSYTDTGLSAGTTYYYQVWVVDTELLAYTSNQVNATPAAQQSLNFIVNNTALTDVVFTVNGKGTYTITKGSSETISYTSNPGSITYSAYTSGKTSGGAVIGEVMYWDEKTIDVSAVSSSYTLSLYVTSSYFLLYFTNSGYDDIDMLYINYGLTSQKMENGFILPADDVKYRLGYYTALENSNVWAHYETADVWNYFYQGTDFTIPFTENQSVHITLEWNALDKNSPDHLNKKIPTINQLIPAETIQGNYKNLENSVFVGCR